MNVISCRRRRLTGGAVFLSLAALVAGCGPSLSPTASTPAPSLGVAPSQGLPSLSGTPSERLTAALTALLDGYTFDTVLTVGGIEAARVTGRWFGDASELSISSGGATVTYRIIPPNAWLQEDSGTWLEADAATATVDPLTPLLSPSGVETTSSSAGADSLVATYPAAALGLAGTDPVTVTISIAADGTITTRYEVTLETGTGVSETVLKAESAQEPILAPSPLAAPNS